jgi:hypothetical protein
VDAISGSLSRAVEELLGRSSGPLHFRLVMQPLVATILAIRAGRRDAKQGQPPFLWALSKNPAERKRLILSGWKDVGKLFIVAVILDTVYQIIALRAVHVLQTLIVAVCVAIVPYVLLRGPVTRLTRRLEKRSPGGSAIR